ncbi:aminoglycoside adenylyltransferase family protein [Achromobacter sp. RTa]|uniref:aminoglycoside adenylyltransferase family protein n=1 Tax=Achromobacter sp. RTa TaxID=1532557 RepID=UPI0006898241|nr:aminoglycoside adenylyltransferase family protein [Achromobacter sp. RTa]
MNPVPPIPIQAGQALAIMQHHLGDTLVACYLHGSALSGGLRPQSDVDVLAIVDRPLARTARGPLVRELMTISAYPARSGALRPLEVMVFCLRDLDPLPYPARSEFLFGEWLRAEFEAGGVPLPVADPELTIVLAQARQQALSLFGPDPQRLLPSVPAQDLSRAMADALPALMASLEGDERNVLLTLARMWRTARTGEIVSKDEAAAWAAALMPAPAARLMQAARSAYLEGGNEDWTARREEAACVARELRAEVERALPRDVE